MTRPSEPWDHLQNTDPNEPVFDALGREVKLGDLIAIGVRTGDTGNLVIGRVTGFSTRKERVHTRVRENEPQYFDSLHAFKGPDGEWIRKDPTYRAPTYDRAVTVQVTYEDPLGKNVYTSGRGKGYTTAYNRRFVVVDS